MKTCKSCGVIKPLAEFNKRHKAKDGYQNWCRDCHKSRYTRIGRDTHRFKNYGITPEQFEKMRMAQNNQCDICKLPFVPHKVPFVDHDHITGAVRGLLCTHCNRGLGGFKDTISILESAQEYIKRYSGTFVV
jgi:hypothetical protein